MIIPNELKRLTTTGKQELAEDFIFNLKLEGKINDEEREELECWMMDNLAEIEW